MEEDDDDEDDETDDPDHDEIDEDDDDDNLDEDEVSPFVWISLWNAMFEYPQTRNNKNNDCVV